MGKGRAVAIVLDDVEERELKALTRKHGAQQALAERARIVLAAASGLKNKKIALNLGLCTHTVGTWRLRRAADGRALRRAEARRTTRDRRRRDRCSNQQFPEFSQGFSEFSLRIPSRVNSLSEISCAIEPGQLEGRLWIARHRLYGVRQLGRVDYRLDTKELAHLIFNSIEIG
jgi:hypothetical protein